MILPAEHKRLLLLIAWDEIKGYLKKEDRDKKRDIDIPEELRTKCGAFVSIYVKDQLRGCIGTFSEDVSLFENVRRMSYSAAAHDNRFPAIRISGLESLLKSLTRISLIEENCASTGSVFDLNFPLPRFSM